MAKRFSVEAVFKAVDNITAPVTRMQNRVGKMTRSMARGFSSANRAMKKFNDGLRKAGRNATIVTGLFSLVSANVIAAGAGFEQAIVDVGAVSLKTRQQIEPLEKLAIKLGATTKFTATQAANAMEVLSRAGFKSSEILESTPAILSAAAASGLEIADVANHVSNVLKGMGLEASRAANISDILALASARTNSSIGSLGESMKNVSATARQLKIPIEDVVAGVALLQDVGLDASVAGSAFNVMLTKMASPSSKIKKIMSQLKISFKDVNGDMKSLPVVLRDIDIASKKMGGNFNQVAFLAELVGLRGQKAASNLSDLFSKGKFSELTEELRRASNGIGAAAEMAKLRMNSVEGSWLLFGSAVDAVKTKIFNLNSGPLKDFIDNMTKWVNANQDLIVSRVQDFLKSLEKTFKFLSKHGESILKIIASVVALSIALKTLTAVMIAVNLVMALNPVGLILVAIAAAIVGITGLIAWWDELKSAFDSSPTWMKVVSKGLLSVISPVLVLVDALVSVIDKFGEIKKFAADFDLSDALGFSGEDHESRQRVSQNIGRAGKRNRGVHVIPPQERIARTIEENRSSAELTIRDDTGRAELTGGSFSNSIKMTQTGAM